MVRCQSALIGGHGKHCENICLHSLARQVSCGRDTQVILTIVFLHLRVRLIIFWLCMAGWKCNVLVENDNVILFWVCARQTQSKVVGLRARVDEETNGKSLWQQTGQLLSAHHQVVVQKAVVCVQGGHLLATSLHHLWVAVTNCNNKNSLSCRSLS